MASPAHPDCCRPPGRDDHCGPWPLPPSFLPFAFKSLFFPFKNILPFPFFCFLFFCLFLYLLPSFFSCCSSSCPFLSLLLLLLLLACRLHVFPWFCLPWLFLLQSFSLTQQPSSLLKTGNKKKYFQFSYSHFPSLASVAHPLVPGEEGPGKKANMGSKGASLWAQSHLGMTVNLVLVGHCLPLTCLNLLSLCNPSGLELSRQSPWLWGHEVSRDSYSWD